MQIALGLAVPACNGGRFSRLLPLVSLLLLIAGKRPMVWLCQVQFLAVTSTSAGGWGPLPEMHGNRVVSHLEGFGLWTICMLITPYLGDGTKPKHETHSHTSHI